MTRHPLRTFERRLKGAGQLPSLYRAVCSMADGDTDGTWLQPDQPITNPYLGVQMLRCGEILGEL